MVMRENDHLQVVQLVVLELSRSDCGADKLLHATLIPRTHEKLLALRIQLYKLSTKVLHILKNEVFFLSVCRVR